MPPEEVFNLHSKILRFFYSLWRLLLLQNAGSTDNRSAYFCLTYHFSIIGTEFHLYFALDDSIHAFFYKEVVYKKVVLEWPKP